MNTVVVDQRKQLLKEKIEKLKATLKSIEKAEKVGKEYEELLGKIPGVDHISLDMGKSSVFSRFEEEEPIITLNVRHLSSNEKEMMKLSEKISKILSPSIDGVKVRVQLVRGGFGVSM